MDYYEIPKISNSALSCIDPEMGGHPEKYANFLLTGKTKDETTDSQSLGDIIHRFLLENEVFDVIDIKLSETLIKITTEYYSELLLSGKNTYTIEDDKELLLYVIRQNHYQDNWKDETVLASVIKSCGDYYKKLVEMTGKTIIPYETKATLTAIETSCMLRPIPEMFNPEQTDEIEVLSEYAIEFEIENPNELFPFGCKAKLDRVVLDHTNKTYTLFDLKSTSGLLEYFQSSFIKYKYYRQIAFYLTALAEKFPGYSCAGAYILTVETKGYNRARLFLVADSYISKGQEEIEELLKRINYHSTTNNWVYPMEEEINNGIYLLNCD